MKRSILSKLLLIDDRTWKSRQSIDFSKILVLKIASAVGSIILIGKLSFQVSTSRTLDLIYLAQILLLVTLIFIHLICKNLQTVRIGSRCLLLSITTALTIMLISTDNLQAAAYHYVSALLLFAGFQLNLRTVLALFVHYSALYLAIGFQWLPFQVPTLHDQAVSRTVSTDQIAEWAILVLFIGLYHRLKERQYKIIADHERSHSHRERLLSISRMAAGIAHEINNPLTILVGYVEILAQGNKVKPLDPKVFPRMQQACERIALIVRGILELSQDQTNAAENVHLRENLQKHLNELSQLPSFQHIESRLQELNFQLTLPQGVWDPIIKALVQNAFEAAAQREGPKVNVSLEWDEATLSLVVADNGPPFDERKISQFFEPFFTSKFDSHGRGMGLTIAHVLATRMGWSLEIRRDGTWTKARITMPRSSIKSQETLLPEAS
jgi:signal transduction histidine kinase